MIKSIASEKPVLFLLIEGPDTIYWDSFKLLKDGLKSQLINNSGGNYQIIRPKSFFHLNSSDFDALSTHSRVEVFILDHRFQSSLIKELLKLRSNLRVWFHLWGKLIPRLKELSELLGDERFGLTVGSKTQFTALTRIFGATELIQYIPYLPHGHRSYLERQDLPLKIDQADGPIFAYIGRISRGKNVTKLMEIFRQYYFTSGKGRLVIAGAPDNTNLFSVPPAYNLGVEAELFFSLLQEYQDAGVPIDYLGHINASQVNKLLSITNRLLSLSTAEEEDFGMSIYEALSLGVPVTLSKWQGHNEFSGVEGVSFLTLNYQNDGLHIDLSDFNQSLSEQTHGERIIQSLEDWKIKRAWKYKLGDYSNRSLTRLNPGFFENHKKDHFYHVYQDVISAFWE
jgi:glycosyltransferase involved in cell wall biosynthesis